MKQISLSILLTLLMSMAGIKAYAYDIAVENADGVTIYYNYYNVGRELEVTFLSSDNSYQDNKKAYVGNVVIPEEVTYMNITRKVTSIGDHAFYECYNLTSVTIPNSVTYISMYAFYGCSSLTSVTIGNSVKSIGNYVFESCYSLTSVTIPNSVTSIGSYAFWDCSSLTSVTIGNSVTTIGKQAFSYCSSLTSVTIPNSVTSIQLGAFERCSSLTSVNISDITAWLSIYFANSYSNPLYYAHHLFLNGEEVNDLVIPNSVTSIGSNAFIGCSGLTSICIPNSVTSIGDYAFWDCSSLTSVTIGNSVTTIGKQAFSFCSSLTSVTVPNSVTSIGSIAFSGCSSLKTLTIGSGITNVDWQAFANCGNLADVYCHAKKVPSTSTAAFDGSYIEYATLHVPEGSVDLYKAKDPWSKFGTIKPFSGEGGEEGEPKKCEKPTISYRHGELSFASATEGVDFVSDITDTDIKMHYGSKVNLSVTYTVSVYATKAGYENSKTAIATLCWIDVDPKTEGIDNGVANVKAMPVLIQGEEGVLHISGAPEGTAINVYEIGGQLVGSAKASSDTTVIPTTLSQGSIAIVKIGEKAVKVLVK